MLDFGLSRHDKARRQKGSPHGRTNSNVANDNHWGNIRLHIDNTEPHNTPRSSHSLGGNWVFLRVLDSKNNYGTNAEAVHAAHRRTSQPQEEVEQDCIRQNIDAT